MYNKWVPYFYLIFAHRDEMYMYIITAGTTFISQAWVPPPSIFIYQKYI